MRAYALTYPQLMGELLDRGWEETDLIAVRRAYDEALRMTRDLYRPSGASFLSHLVRTASIASQATNHPASVCAALLHASYSLGAVGGIFARLTRAAPRDALRALAGSEVEEIVFAYDRLPWNDEAALQEHLESHAGYPEPRRRALLLRLANELEDHMDAGRRFHAGGAATAGHHTTLAAILARSLGYPELGDEIQESIEAAQKRQVPQGLRTGRRLAYRSSWKRLPELYGLRTHLRSLVQHQRGKKD